MYKDKSQKRKVAILRVNKGHNESLLIHQNATIMLTV